MSNLTIGSLIRHWELGIGKVQAIDAQGLTINFRDGASHLVKPDDVTPLADDGFWSQAFAEPDTVAQRVKDSPVNVITLLLRDFPRNEARTDEIRAQLGEFVTDWTPWWQQTQNLLKQEPTIDTSRSREGIYALAEKPRTRIDELYQEFRALPDFKTTSANSAKMYNSRKFEVARGIMNQAPKDDDLVPSIRNHVRDYMLAMAQHESVPIAERTEAILRLAERRWVPDPEVASVLTVLSQKPIKIYDLNQFSQNRIIDSLLKHVGMEVGRASFLTAFATEASQIHMATDIFLRGRTEMLMQGLWSGLGENLIDNEPKDAVLRWYKSLASRLQGLGQLFQIIIFDVNLPVDWKKLAEHLTHLLNHLNKLDSSEKVPPETMQSFTALWRRVIACAPYTIQANYLDVPLAMPFRPHLIEPMLAAIYNADPAFNLANRFMERVDQKPDLSLASLLQCFANNYWGYSSAVGVLSHLALRFKATRPDVLSWIAEHVLKVVQDKPEALPQYLPVFDQLAQADSRATWSGRVDIQRQQAFYRLCEAVEQGESILFPPFTFDTITLAGLRNFLTNLAEETQEMLNEFQAQVAQAQAETQAAQDQLRQTTASLEELRQGYRQPDRDSRFAERRRILEGLAATTAEFERFAARQQTKELIGVARRLNRLLADFGTEPFGTLGEEVRYDPARHEFVGASQGTIEMVKVIERGYTIQGLSGQPQVLKPAKVSLE
ncbi:MAG: hypothetical protein KJ077_28880 [Anaerolineae bacterium]|nr:hypothetical protein [Anaerolineae bacterium]